MILVQDLEKVALARDVVLTIGSFDGVHRGHQYLLAQLVARARELGCWGAALTFYPHPRTVLGAASEMQYLSSRKERRDLLAQEGLDALIELPFTVSLANQTAEEFTTLLHDQVRMRELWVGAGFRMGRGGEAAARDLDALAARVGFRACVVEPLVDGGSPISSTRIRHLLSEGHVDEAARLLGHPMGYVGRVIRGARRGRDLGFPTANMALDPTLMVPMDGVYAVWATVGEERYPAVANVGGRPSFDSDDRLLEVHLMDYEGQLYGTRLLVQFVKRLRSVQRFDTVEALVSQIRRDVDVARLLLDPARERA